MAVTVCLPLFGNPGHELEEGVSIQGRHLRELAATLNERLQHAADVLERLSAAGWTAQLAMYEVILVHPDVATRAEAVQRLQQLQLNPDDFMVLEDVAEEEDEPE